MMGVAGSLNTTQRHERNIDLACAIYDTREKIK